MAREVTIPFPEGLNGDYGSPREAAPAADPCCPPPDVAAARAFRASLMRLDPLREPANAGPLPRTAATRLAA